MRLNCFQIIYCPKEVQIICLSATVANADELVGWIGQVCLSVSIVSDLCVLKKKKKNSDLCNRLAGLLRLLTRLSYIIF